MFCPDSATRDAIEALLVSRSRALCSSDSATAIATLLHPAYRYTDSMGRSFDLASYMERRRTGNMAFTAQEQVDLEIVMLSASAAVLHCRVHDVGAYKGQPMDAWYRAMHVVVRDGDAWRFIAGQSTWIEGS